MSHCIVCHLTSEHPGISVDADQVCNLCKLQVDGDLLDNVKTAAARYEAFRTSAPDPRREYDCLLMFSGGKDSTYLLDKFVNEDHKRVLAYTFDVPFESRHAEENIRRAQAKIPATYVLDRDDDNIKKVVRHVFNGPAPQRPGKYLDEKLPCVSCRTFFVLRAILYAWRHGIPYLVFCADPQQIMTIQADVREIVKSFYRSFGRELGDGPFARDLENLLFAEEDQLPQIVFPFVSMRQPYDPDAMITALKAKGLYASSPLETHCTLFPLLNYYSLKHWDCMFYKLNASSARRAARHPEGATRATYSIKFPRAADLLAIESRLKTTLFEIAAGQGDPAQQEQELVALFLQLDSSEDAAHFLAQSCLAMRTVAADVGIELH